MARGKARPVKRPRADSGETNGRPPAVPVDALTPSLLEHAEVERLRALLASGGAGRLAAGVPPPVQGLCRGTLADPELAALTALHRRICERLEGSLAPWGGVDDQSGRARGYGYFPGTLGEAFFSGASTLSMRELRGAKAAEDREANRRASVMLHGEDLPEECLDAVERVCAQLRPSLPSRYRAVLCRENLVAAQPNLHNGQAYLRPHLDEPLHDGFGIVIVTLAIQGSADIILRAQPWDPVAQREFWFELSPGDAYVLCGEARNTCVHGVLAHEGSEHRASLNLRFGLHSRDPADAWSAWNEVDRHWPQTGMPSA
ncbi:hypothetical protein AB1Y20_009987 [Prymnesium parvum]|uniref:Fe2OG dioxygenase domain-containing protein n=1 Tax=Prymnesium parvum TaxID=97485 RepID=A0AB34K3L9_PRYPA